MIKLKTLIFEVSLDQLKTQFVDTAKITDSEFTEIIDASGGKTAYATWLTKLVADKTIKPEDLYKYNAYLKVFDRRKREYTFQDINQYKTSQDISQFIDTSVELANREKSDPSQQKGVAKVDKYKEFYIGSVEGFNVYELPKGRTDLYGTSCELGSGTEWCTATNKTTKWFDKYVKQGPIFIFIKPGSDEKYQFAYQSRQFMDKKDKRMNFLMPIAYKFFEFIESKYPKRKIYKMPWSVKLAHAPTSLTKEDLTIQGDLYLSNDEAYDKISTKLPNGLTVTGDLTVAKCSLTKLPDDLTVGGDLNANFSDLNEIPKRLVVTDGFGMSGTPLADTYTKSEVEKMLLDNNCKVRYVWGLKETHQEIEDWKLSLQNWNQ